MFANTSYYKLEMACSSYVCMFIHVKYMKMRLESTFSAQISKRSMQGKQSRLF